MSETAERICVFAPSNLPILILGDSGTGKTELAGAIHEMYNVARQTANPFFKVTCTAVHDNTLVSELFGHRKGSFANAYADRAGYFETAGAGTIFLDEIGHVTLEFQRMLLEVVETGTFRRLGCNIVRTSTARIVTATWAQLHDLVAEKKFDQGLADRLSVVVVRIPPLEKRKDDLIPTASAILRKLCPSKKLSASAEHELRGTKWPGNARQLRKVLEYALHLSGAQSEIGPSHIRDATANTSIGEYSDAASPRTEIPNGSTPAKPATTPRTAREGDAIWRAWTAGSRLFECEKAGSEYSVKLLTKGGTVEEQRVQTKEKPSLYHLWLQKLGDLDLGRAVIVRIMWETPGIDFFKEERSEKKPGEQSRGLGVLKEDCILARIGRYLDFDHVKTVRVQITNANQDPKRAIALYKATHRDSEYFRLMQKYFSDAPTV